MSVELRPLGVRCNIACRYCYQDNQRHTPPVSRDYDLDAMKRAIEEEGGPFTVFGGEPLLLPIADLEELWSWGLMRFGSNGIQTNGTLITDRHIQLFRTYRVHVGISIDGPGDLNDLRWTRNPEHTRKATGNTETAIQKLCAVGLVPSLIVTLHKINAAPDKLDRLLAWVREMDALGIGSMRLHLMESESAAIRNAYALSTDEYVAALTAFMRMERELSHLRFDLFADIRNMLLGQDTSTSCIWHACDPHTTPAVRGVEGAGQRSTCGRANKEGIQFVRPDSGGFERYLSLYGTPQEFGGCKACRFFLMCKGNCPGTGIRGDWRQRTEHCDVLKVLFSMAEEEIEAAGGTPLSTHPDREKLEAAFLQRWSEGRQPLLSEFVTVSQPHPELDDVAAVDLHAELQHIKQGLHELQARYVTASAR
jgi:uncharacterized protein